MTDLQESVVAVMTAVQKERELFRDIALQWATVMPSSPGAREALAIALALLGSRTALDTLVHARELAVDTQDQIRLAASEVWMRLAFALPNQLEDVRRAKKLADSLLQVQPVETALNPLMMSGLAALTGRAHTASEYAVRAAEMGSFGSLPLSLQRVVPAYLVYSAMGGPTGEIRSLEQLINTAIDVELPAGAKQNARLAWVGRGATLAFPEVRLEAITKLAGTGDPLVDFQAAWRTADTAAVNRYIDSVRTARQAMAGESVTMDNLFPEAHVLFQMGRFEDAVHWLDPPIKSLPRVPPNILGNPVRAGALVRALTLRALLERTNTDSDAPNLWAAIVAILWRDADEFLQPIVRQLDGYNQ